MPLSNEERVALRARAAGLREEVSVARAEAEVALQQNSLDVDDAKLMQEVERLESEVADAKAARDRALRSTGSVADAIQLMNEVAGQPVSDEDKAPEEKLADAVVAPEVVAEKVVELPTEEVVEVQPAAGSPDVEQPKAPAFTDFEGGNL